MLKISNIECCRVKMSGRLYSIAPNTYLIYADECVYCGQSVAEIRHKTPTGEFITSLRRKGKAADRLLEKYGLKFLQFDYKTYSGTRTKEYNFINKYGIVYNDNNVKIAPQDEFLKMSRQEINTVLNKRFYATGKIKI